MNSRFHAFTKHAIGGFYAYIRFARDGEAKPIRNSDGNAIIFEKETDAYKAIIEKLNEFFGGNMRRDGEIMGHSRQEAERHFHQAGE